jgi:RNA polymerase sigma-70 factor (ECF subfamily)
MSMGANAKPGPAASGDELAAHRAELLRHCYRMLGSFAEAEDVVQDVLFRAWRSRETYAGDAPLAHWLMRIATNACLNVLTRDRTRALPQLDREPVAADAVFSALEAATWVTPAPDARLFPDPARAAEAREDVALAFIALLQRLPPRQRAVLLLKDVLGWAAEEIAETLAMTLSSVNSALHRARDGVVARPRGSVTDPAPDVLGAYVRSWEERDLATLVSLLQKDVVFAMPPHEAWFQGAGTVEAFLQTPRFASFWASGLRALATRANGLPAVAWYSAKDGDGVFRLHSLHVMRFVAGRLAEATNFIGAPYLVGFDLPPVFPDA